MPLTRTWHELSSIASSEGGAQGYGSAIGETKHEIGQNFASTYGLEELRLVTPSFQAGISRTLASHSS